MITPATDGPMDAQGFERWRVRVDDVGLDPHDAPPPSLLEVARRAGCIVSSDLPRSLESARALAPGRTIDSTPLLREIPLPVPRTFPVRLPRAAWEALVHARWGWDLLRGADASPPDVRRAVECADRLEARSRAEPVILVVTHGVFRRLLARTLRARGWDLRGRRRYSHWSLWSLSRGGGDRA